MQYSPYVASAKQAVVLAMRRDDAVLCRRGFHSLEHHTGVLHSAAVIGKGHASALERREVHEFQALAALGDGRVRKYLHHCVAVYDILLHGQVL